MTLLRLARTLGFVPLMTFACAEAHHPPTTEAANEPQAVTLRADRGELHAVAADPGDARWVADVTLPRSGDLATRIRDRASGMVAEVRLEAARPSPPAFGGAGVTYQGAGPHAGDLVERPTLAGSEDFLTVPRKPASEEVVYHADVSSAAGLRLVANVLELLDASGTPRLRMAAPYLIDHRGHHVDARVSLDDCAADRDGRAPWGRPVVAPGRRECAVRVSWGGGGRVEYPAVLDPSWTSTKGNMTTARRAHTATLLPSGQVLIAGGEAMTGVAHLMSAELFDPKTNTFAATGSMTEGRSQHVAVLLKNGNVVLIGGAALSNSLASTEMYESGKFRTVGQLHTARAAAQGTLLASGQIFVAGGLDFSGKVTDTTELYDTTAETWTVAPIMTHPRTGHYMTTLANGGALVVAGITTTTFADLVACEIYTPATQKWMATGTLGEARYNFGAATLSDGRVLAAAGYEATSSACTDTAEIFDPMKQTWSKAGKLAAARTEPTLTALPGGGAIAAGGVVRNATRVITSYLASVEAYDAASNTWSALPDMKEARSAHSATALTDGRILVAGGDTKSGPIATAELLTLDPKGTACKLAATCTSGFCVDGVCCDTACDTSCNACVLASTGKANGTCALVIAGKDPHGDCKDDGSPTCKKDGQCDGAGACEDYPKSSACGPSACTTNDDCTSGFCADGICCNEACTGKCEACTKALQGSGTDGTCGPVAKATDPDKDCGNLGTGVCKGPATCDGASACLASTAGKDCAAAMCSDAVTLAKAATCGADGACAPDTLDCTPYLCDAKAVACTKKCDADADCAPGATCMGGACTKSPTGAACAKALECTSGFCADGFCCDLACTGQCESCDGTPGTCSPTSGDPKNGRTPCDGTGTCAGTCNGFRAMCDYPHSDKTCEGTASCTGGMETVSRCNGSGLCVATPRACSPFQCGTDGCKASCTSDSDCVDGVHCDRNGVCTMGIALTCSGDTAVTQVDGGVRSCGAYRCTNGACGTSCKTGNDCNPGATCANGKCEAGKDSGCGCTLGGRADDGGAIALALASLALIYRKRHRRPATKRVQS